MKITDHFSLAEFAQRAGHGCAAEPYPQEYVLPRLTRLCELLEALRAELGGAPIRIVSGYRSEEYNRRIGGARYSQHCLGRAADIVAAGVSPAKVHDTALRLHRAGRISLGGLGRYPGFTHVDIRPGALTRWVGSRQ